MSVRVLSSEEYMRIGITLLYDHRYGHQHGWASIPSRVRDRIEADTARGVGQNKETAMEADLLYWLRRLIMANQCAYILNYEHHGDELDRTLYDLDISGIERAREYPALEMLAALQNLRYNLATLTGKIMLGAEDLGRLENVIQSYMTRQLMEYGYQEEKRAREEREAREALGLPREA